METLTEILGYVIYAAQAVMALYGAFLVILIWRRIAQSRFKNENVQAEFIEEVDQGLATGDFDGVAEMCEGDRRVLPQLVQLAVLNRNLGFTKVRQVVADHFQRYVLADLDYRMSWVATIIKTAPMLGLFGTVGGMMGAFRELGSGGTIDGAKLASNISLALITTVIGLAVAIPLMLCISAINVRLRKMEDLVGLGVSQFMETFKHSLESRPNAQHPPERMEAGRYGG